MPSVFAIHSFFLCWFLAFGSLAFCQSGELSDEQFDEAMGKLHKLFEEMDAEHADDPLWNRGKERSLGMVEQGYSLEAISEAGWRDFWQSMESVLNSPSDFSATQEQIEGHARTFNERRRELWLSSKKGWLNRSEQEEQLLGFVRQDLLLPLVRDNANMAAYLRPEQLVKAIIRGAPTPPEESVSAILNRRGGNTPDVYLEKSLPSNHRIMAEVFRVAREERSPNLVRLGAWIAQETGQRFDVSWLDEWPEAFDYILEGTDFEALRHGRAERAPMSLVDYALKRGSTEHFEKLAAVEKKFGFSIWWNAQTARWDSSTLASATHSGGSCLLQGALPRLVQGEASEMARLLPGLAALCPYDRQPILDRMFYWVVRETGDVEKLKVLRVAGANPLAVVGAPYYWSDWCHYKYQFLTGGLDENKKFSDSAFRFLSAEAKQAVASDLRPTWRQRCALRLYALSEFNRVNLTF
jgi:hypothetical protein